VKEAKIASDLLHAHGFDVKLYPDDTHAKLYVTQPLMDDATIAEKLASARLYAHNFRQIKQLLDALNSTENLAISDYVMNCSSNVSGMQINVQLLSERVSKKAILNPTVVASQKTTHTFGKPP